MQIKVSPGRTLPAGGQGRRSLRAARHARCVAGPYCTTMDRHLAMQCFCRVVETGSFAAAARDLDCSRSVVTKYVQYLEDWTQSRLIARTTRAMQLTQAGEQFYEYCKRVVRDTEDTLGAIRDAGATPTGRLVVAAPVSITLGWLGDLLHDFASEHPAIELEVRLSDHASDLVREGIDVALRGRGPLEDSSLVAVPLCSLERAVAAAPSFWKQHGLPAHPRDLQPRHCLPYLLGSDAFHWRFTGPDGVHSLMPAGRIRTDNSLLLLDAMRRGLGVGLVPTVLLDKAGASLQRVLTEWRTEPRNLFAVYASRRYPPARTTALVRYLRRRLAGNTKATRSTR